MYEFTLPWPPTVNHYHQPIRLGKSVRIIKGQKAREYEEVAVEHMKEQGLTDELISDSLAIHITLNPPTLRKYDIDNRNKAILDAITAAKFWLDDDQVERMVVVKGEKTKGGRVKVTVKALNE